MLSALTVHVRQYNVFRWMEVRMADAPAWMLHMQFAIGEVDVNAYLGRFH